jgi:4'-phosphopantetheinyl transferase
MGQMTVLWQGGVSGCAVYRVSADDADNADVLSPAERARAAALKRPADAAAFIARRAALRRLLADWLGVTPAEVRLTTGAHGKPMLAEGLLHFSLSHRRGISVIALAAAQIGIDLEFVDSRVQIDSIAARFFAPDELETLSQRPIDARRDLFFWLWTRKEAFVKALGVGISGSRLGLSALADAIEVEHERWTLESQRVDGGWVSVCVQEPRQRRTQCSRLKSEAAHS